MDAGCDVGRGQWRLQGRRQAVPPITGEDQNDYLTKWKAQNLNWMAPTYPTYQWRTPIIAATMILNGEKVPKEWVLPEPAITARTSISTSIRRPPLFYPLCGCQKIPATPRSGAASRKRCACSAPIPGYGRRR